MWLTSFESIRWEIPREVAVRVLSPGAQPAAQDTEATGAARPRGGAADERVDHVFAVLRVASDQPDGPMVLLARRRDGKAWDAPVGRASLDIAVWVLPSVSPAPADAGEVRRPLPAPTAWCDLVETEAEAVAIYEAQRRQGHSFLSWAECMAARGEPR